MADPMEAHQKSTRHRTPALDTWRRELARGERAAETFDALWRAACEEVRALEAPTAETRERCLLTARRIVEAARTGWAA